MNLISPAEGTLIGITNKCNLNCKFCNLKYKDKSPKNKVLKKELKPHTNLILCGGEPFVSKNIIKHIFELKKLNYDISIITNGRIFIYQNLIEKIAPLLKYIIINIFLPEEKIYEQFTGCLDGFKQSLEGINKLITFKNLYIELRYPICEKTIKYAPKVPKSLLTISKNSNFYLVFTLFDSKEKKSNYSILHQLSKYSPLFEEMKKHYQIYIENIPICILEHITHIDSNRFYQYKNSNEICPLISNKLRYKKLLQCSECIYDNVCKGVPINFYIGSDSRLIIPTKGVKSNSFDYIKIKDKLKISPPVKDCKIHHLFPFDKPMRYLFLNNKNEISLYYTDTNSFSEDDIKKVKLERMQLYIDKSNKTTPDDFQNDIKLLKIDPYCERCKNINQCAAFFTISKENPFIREERWIRQEIRRLVGRILDIGCGDMMFYKDIINKLLRDNKIEYWGIDINEKALKRLKRDIPQAYVIKSSIEEFNFKNGYFDYIFLLRSLNHFYNIDKAFHNISNLLRNYGMIIIAECVPFALLRNPQKVEIVRKSRRPVFEHYRNWSSEDLINYIRTKGFKFKIDTHKPVQAGTSNQWIVKLMKIE